MTSTQKPLGDRLKKQMEGQSRQVETMAQSELQRFGEQLRQLVNDELDTIKSAMAAQNANVLEEIRACGAAATTTVKEEERTLEATIAASTARTYRQLLRRWSVPVMVSLMLSLGIFSGSWGTMQWLSSRIQQQYKALSLLQLETERAESTLTRLRGATWGVTLHRDRQGRFVVLPSGTEISREWTVRARPAVRLGN